jgi:hypothetical protein
MSQIENRNIIKTLVNKPHIYSKLVKLINIDLGDFA